MNSYDKYQVVKLKVTFTLGGVIDPTTVTFKIIDPAGHTTTYVYGTDSQLVRDSEGVYYVIWTLSLSGGYDYEFIGTGVCAAAVASTLYTKFSAF